MDLWGSRTGFVAVVVILVIGVSYEICGDSSIKRPLPKKQNHGVRKRRKFEFIPLLVGTCERIFSILDSLNDDLDR